MSSNRNSLNYKQVTNVKRRTWDKETYERKAKDRELKQEQGSGQDAVSSEGFPDGSNQTSILREEFVHAAADRAGPEGSKRAYLKARTHAVRGIDDKIGSTEIISIEAATKNKTNEEDGTTSRLSDATSVMQKVGVGWHCKVCDCFLKDSHTYLDHINGRKHQRALGYSMRVERASKEDLISKLQQLTEEKKKNDVSSKSESLFFGDLVKQKDDAERYRNEERQRKRKDRRKQLVAETDVTLPSEVSDGDNGKESEAFAKFEGQRLSNVKINEGENDVEDGDYESGMDPNLASLMGFTGFGGNKRH